MSEAKPWCDIPPCAGQHEVAVFTPAQGVGRGGQLWGIDIKLPHWLPEKPVEGHSPAIPLINIVEREF